MYKANKLFRFTPEMMTALQLALAMVAVAVVRADLAKTEGGEKLHGNYSVYLTRDVLSHRSVEHLIGLLPAGNSPSWTPCVGQRLEFMSKRCTLLNVTGDKVLQAALATISSTWNIDTSRLATGGLPIIRYLPGAPAVGVHGDKGASGYVPNATIVLYLTDAEDASTPHADGEKEGPTAGQTYFPNLGIAVTPVRGSALSFVNVDAHGVPHPAGRHGVAAIPSSAKGDRLVVQIPIAAPGRERAYAYAEHVSGAKHVWHMGFIMAIFAGYFIWQAMQGQLVPNPDNDPFERP